MLNHIKKILFPGDNIRLTILVSELLDYPKFIEAVYVWADAVENIHLPTSCITIVLFDKHSNYLKFMNELQSNGLNLREDDVYGLKHSLVRVAAK